MSPRRRGDEGSLALELTIIAPLLLVLLGLVYAYGRVGGTTASFDAGVRDAARAATQSRSADAAQAAAEASLRDAVGPGTCASTLDVRLDRSTWRPGGLVHVDATCDCPLGDLGLPGAPGTLHLASSFTSPLDPNRGVDGAAA